jgi:phage terminase large subunit
VLRQLYGGAGELFLSQDREVVIAGGARTGKTNGTLVKAKWEAETFPGWRQLFVRMTRRSLSESVLPDWESKILGHRHAALGQRQRDGRSTYQFPNGSTVILGGMDDPAGFLSSELDSVKFFQGEQLPSVADWETLLTRLSGSAGPYQQAVLDVNPGGTRHWILKRCREAICLACGNSHEDLAVTACARCGGAEIGRMRWIDSRHEDNPLFFDHQSGAWRPKGREYLLGVLGRLRGPQREKYRNHQWVDEAGRVLEDFDPAVHLLGGELVKTPGAGWLLHVKHPSWSADAKDPMRRTPVPIDWFGAGYDWGFSPDPGNLQVWAYDRYGRRFLVVEVCRLKWQVDQWAELAERLWKEFQFRYIACDPSFNAIIEAFNRRLTPFAGRGAPAIAIGADNRLRSKKDDMLLAGIDLLRWGFRDGKGEVRTFLMRDAAREGIDAQLREEGRPCGFEEEIPSWVFATKASTGELMAVPSDACDDHGCAAARYECGEGWGKRLSEKVRPVQQYPEKSLGALLRHGPKQAKLHPMR